MDHSWVMLRKIVAQPLQDKLVLVIPDRSTVSEVRPLAFKRLLRSIEVERQRRGTFLQRSTCDFWSEISG